MTKTEFAVRWFRRGQCPGCGHDLKRLVLGRVGRHQLSGKAVGGGEGGKTWGAADPSVCPFDADDLTSLVLIATGVVTDRLHADRVQENREGAVHGS